MEEAKVHFKKSPEDVVILDLDADTFELEDHGVRRGILDVSGIKPGPNGRLTIQGKGIDKTILVFAGDKHAIYGRDANRITVKDRHMTRKEGQPRVGCRNGSGESGV